MVVVSSCGKGTVLEVVGGAGGALKERGAGREEHTCGSKKVLVVSYVDDVFTFRHPCLSSLLFSPFFCGVT